MNAQQIVRRCAFAKSCRLLPNHSSGAYPLDLLRTVPDQMQLNWPVASSRLLYEMRTHPAPFFFSLRQQLSAFTPLKRSRLCASPTSSLKPSARGSFGRFQVPNPVANSLTATDRRTKEFLTSLNMILAITGRDSGSFVRHLVASKITG